jgi:DNA-binding NtrC family response regulator
MYMPRLVLLMMGRGPRYSRGRRSVEAGRRRCWRGNVRERENTVERALALSKDGIIMPSDLPHDAPETLRARRAMGVAA